ncbi:MAG: sulfatase-like hydrolase/transferase [Armatimonadetes bacterium]|nr:sulfatase-like hydrolase/transferase [Armatimonadota bacterium]
MRPNILFVICDDHRGSAIGALGDAAVKTPVIDRLVARGTAFTNAHHEGSLCPAVCVPARSCLHTGANVFRSSSSTTVGDYQGLMRLPSDRPLLVESLRQHGYQTFVTGKWHNCRASLHRCFGAGESIFLGGMGDHHALPVYDHDPSGEYPKAAERLAEGFSTEVFCNSAIRFIEGYTGENPFFCYLAFTSPHDPRTPPEEFAALYPPAELPLPPNAWAEHPFDPGVLHIRDEELAGYPRDPGEVRQHLADYYGMISHHDAHLGRVLAALEQTGHGRNTVVVYTSDHGLAVGQHALLGKQNLYEHSTRVPLILAGPGVPAGRQQDQLVHGFDLHPTILELAGVPLPATVEARSLRQLWEGRASGRKYVGCLYEHRQRMIRDERWKLIRYYRREDRGSEALQLFDLASDPWETCNRAADPSVADELARLAAAMRQWMAEAGDPLADEPVLAAPAGAGPAA